MTHTTKEVLAMLGELAVKYGPTLIEDAFTAMPKLKEDPLPPADVDMDAARAEALERINADK